MKNTVKLTEDQAKLTIYLLQQYSERLGNDGCNDLSKEEEKLIKPLEKDILKLIKEEDEENELICNFSLPYYIKTIIKKQLKD